MSRKIKHSHKRNLRFISSILFILMLTVNLTIFLVSENFKTMKLQEENEEFLILTTYLINDNDEEVALEYIDHYSYSHSVEVEIYSNDEIIYSSVVDSFDYTQHKITTNKGDYVINIDNTHNITVDLLNQKYFYANVISVILFIIAITTLYLWNKKTSLKIENDVLRLLHLIQQEDNSEKEFSFTEFDLLQQYISSYITELDLLRARRQLNIKGLAHDIKTPLTIINDYIQNKTTSTQTIDTVISSIQKISRLVDNIIDDNYTSSFVEINVNDIVKDTIKEYQSIFNSKDITIHYSSDTSILLTWSKKDLKVVLENLFSNAYYYSEEHTKYDISITKKEQIPVIEFTSIGNQIPKHQLQKIFEKGFRNESLKPMNVSGKGLGLYLTKLLLQPIGATIQANIKDDKNVFTITFKES